jgi:threonine synthase
MPLCSTNDRSLRHPWSEGVLKGIAPDGGLYMPVEVPILSRQELEALRGAPFTELAFHLAHSFLKNEVPTDLLKEICAAAFTFDAPLREIAPNTHILELFHGPTCAFKDFGARFMARLFRHFLGDSEKPLTVLVATSGDTGSAVANAFFDKTTNPLLQVSILFPKGKVTPVQEKQMTTLGHNVTAFEVDGTFDDCQAIVKRALSDEIVTAKKRLTSANSINIARLLPQVFYYAYAVLQLPDYAKPIISVPSGNLGNLTGGLIAHRLGAPAEQFIAACNRNAPFPTYLRSGLFSPHPSYETISNAMDVGNPSNFSRVLPLFNDETTALRELISGDSVSDDDTRTEIRRCFRETGYVVCPHTAVGLVAANRYAQQPTKENPHIILATAHPAKFAHIVEPEINRAVEYPSQLAEVMNQESRKVSLTNSYSEFVRHLLA